MHPDPTPPPAAELIVGAFARATAGLSVTALDGRILAVNDALCRLLGVGSPEELIGRYWEHGLVEDAAADRHHTDRMLRGELAGFERQARLRRTDGSHVTVLMSVALVRDPGGRPAYFLGYVLDATGRAAVEQDLRVLADVDALTGVFNRRRFQYELDRAIYHGRRYGTPTGLLMIDVDGLKPVNDRFGHLAGDDLLVSVARTMAGRLRKSDVLARIGGDEFAVLLPAADESAARRVADELRAAVAAEPVRTDGAVLEPSITVGAAWSGAGDDVDARTLVRRADEALYAAKRRGRD